MAHVDDGKGGEASLGKHFRQGQRLLTYCFEIGVDTVILGVTAGHDGDMGGRSGGRVGKGPPKNSSLFAEQIHLVSNHGAVAVGTEVISSQGINGQ